MNTSSALAREDASLSLTKEQRLELENFSLKVHIAKTNYQELERNFKTAVQQAFSAAGLDIEEYGLDLNSGKFVKK